MLLPVFRPITGIPSYLNLIVLSTSFARINNNRKFHSWHDGPWKPKDFCYLWKDRSGPSLQ